MPNVKTPALIQSANKTKKKTRGRAQSAMLDLTLSSFITLVLTAFLIHSTMEIVSTTREAQDGYTLNTLSQASASYLKANQNAFIRAINSLPRSNKCSALGTTADGKGLVYAISGQLPQDNSLTDTTDTCQTLSGVNLLPPGTNYQNAYRQTYYLAVTTVPGENNTQQISAALFTAGGASIPDRWLNVYAQMTSPFAMITTSLDASTGNQAHSVGQIFSQSASSNKFLASLSTAGHITNSIDPYLNPQIDLTLHRNGTFEESAPNQMNTTLAAAAEGNADGKPVDVALNGPVAAETNTAITLAHQNYATSPSTAPQNGVYGARQIDTQMLTAGNSIRTPYASNSAQAQAEHSKTTTINDAYNDPGNNSYTDNNGTTKSRFANNMMLVNTNLNITAGYRLSAADGYHVTATTSTLQNDFNNSPNGTQTGEVPTNGFGVYTYSHTIGIPGLTWDAAQGSGLMIYNDLGARNYAPNDPFGATFWIATYSKNTVAPGLEATGGMRAPVYYSDRAMDYYVSPDYFSRLSTIQAGDINLVGDGINDYNINKTTSGTLRTSGKTSSAWPQGWAGTGIITFDVYSDGGTVGVGYGGSLNAYIGRDGNSYASGHMDTSIFRSLVSYHIGNRCLNQPIKFSDNQSGKEQNAYIQAGDQAKSDDANPIPIYCDGSTGNWQSAQTTSLTYLCNGPLSINKIGPITNSSPQAEYITAFPNGDEENGKGRDVALVRAFISPPGANHSLDSSGQWTLVDQTLANSVNKAIVAQLDTHFWVPAGWSWFVATDATYYFGKPHQHGYNMYYSKYGSATDFTGCP